MALNDLGRMLQDCAEWVARIVLYNEKQPGPGLSGRAAVH